LNLRQDRYFAIEQTQTVGFAALVRGWPLDDRAAPAESSAPAGGTAAEERAAAFEGVMASNSAAGERVAVHLLNSGLLVSLRNEPEAKTAALAAPSQLAGEVIVPAMFSRPRVRLRDVSVLAQASALALASLEWRGLANAISRVKRRNERLGAGASANGDTLSSLIALFAALRPFFFTSREKCLLTSLILSDFLARHGIRTECVMGVRAKPFSAHCWLEHSGQVLNDTVERVRRYTPILRV
jgi:hypothetical protein